MEKRLLLAFVLSLLVLMVSQSLLQKKKPLLPKAGSSPPDTSQTGAPASSPGTGLSGETPASNSLDRGTGNDSTQAIKAESEQEIVLENNLVRVVLTNRSVVVKSWVLKNYLDSNRKTLDLVAGNGQVPGERPLRLIFPSDPDLGKQIDSALFVESKETAKEFGSKVKSSVTMRYSENGIAVEKALTLRPNSYLAEANVLVSKKGSDQSFLVAWPAQFGDSALDAQSDMRELITFGEKKTDKTTLMKIKEVKDLTEGYRVAGVVDHYFAAMFLPRSSISRIQLTPSGAALALPPQPFNLFVGPKEINLLKQVDPQLEGLVDFGWFTIIAKPLFIGLKWIYGFCKNYGVAVILLTTVINMALFPLRWKSMVSAQKMQKLQPKVKMIQEKYKKYKASDPKKQEMNQEMMALYKEHGVNPLGGCLPLLLQMPILIAFYNVLNVAIDLRQVSFLWIPDLSQHDKTFILVIVMVITQFIMQKMTPNPSTDPAQAKVFMLMPLVFGFMFAKVASGLVLYWLTGNVIGIVQQFFLNRFGITTFPVAVKGAGKKE